MYRSLPARYIACPVSNLTGLHRHTRLRYSAPLVPMASQTLIFFNLAWDPMGIQPPYFRTMTLYMNNNAWSSRYPTLPSPPPDRLTFTPPLLNAAHNVLFLATGSDKADAVQAVLEGPYRPDQYPAQIVRPKNGEMVWMLDTAAAAKLQVRK